jgi:aldehyde:ferredoxin oxidoreductase
MRKRRSNSGISSYRGQILHIDLAARKSWIESIPERVYDLLLGGKGLGVYLLFRTPPRSDPLGSENDLIFVTGPLTSTIAPCASKFGVVTKGPASGGFLDSYSSGRISWAIKYAGYDAIIIHKQAADWLIVTITEDQVEFHDAVGLNLLTKSPLETERLLNQKFGNKYSCACIGLAGERLSPLAGIFTEQRCAGRGGAGAVMGSKKLKALAITGTKGVKVADPIEFRKAAWRARRSILSSEITVRAMPQEGTANIIDVIHEKGGFPTKNFQIGMFNDIDKINGEAWRTKYWVGVKGQKPRGSIACPGCPIGCSKITYSSPTGSDVVPLVIDGPEYETIYALGSNLLNSNPDVIIQADYLCDYYGIDTISTGGVLACVMESVDHKILSTTDLDGIEVQWGNSTTILSLIRKIGTMEGCGQILGKGVKGIAEKWPATLPFVMHVKGLELPGYDPRAARGMGLGYAVSDRGACHLHAFTAAYELLGQSGGADPFDVGPKKLEIFLNAQAESNLMDCAILCFFTLNGLQSKEIRALLIAATANESIKSPRYVGDLAQRVLTLTRLFNYREGFSMKDDQLPRRFFTEDQNSDNNSLRKPLPDFGPVLQAYYHTMGWDDIGRPTSSTIASLKISELLPDIK